MSYYQVFVRLGESGDGHEWTITRASGPGQVDDDLRVCDDLTMQWSMPAGLWPQQPNPMGASLALNVPNFADVADLEEGDRCAIEIKLHPSDAPVFGFYGRITDLQAVPRPGRSREGVTLSIIAIDYTTERAELGSWLAPSPFPSAYHSTRDLLELLWDDPTYFGLRGDFPGLSGTGDPLVRRPEVPVPAAELIDQLLRQYVSGSGSSVGRLIMAPYISNSSRRPETSQGWSFDIIRKNSAATPLEIPARLVERGSLSWLYSKGTGVTRVEVANWGGDEDDLAGGPVDITGNVTSVENSVGTHAAGVTERVDVTLVDEDDAEDLAAFYLPSSTASRWRIATLRYLVTRRTLAELDNFTTELWPQWLLSPAGSGRVTRAACYGRPLVLTDVPASLNPYATGTSPTDVEGRLDGVTLQLVGRHLTLDLQLRETN